MKRLIAHNLCLTCAFEWEAHPGPATHCPACGAFYVKWVNYGAEKKRAALGERPPGDTNLVSSR